ncbi:hypothetical protein L6164_023949 [Bauhinia variegata]|uniref:Uncharacterized protein n=1 Tax=Bauhinia variegata TaxID=167791 RepID=A0ACB9LYC8_BAUVA|nr:hypothetical protein L6164_023949 [Bauhinia variegata]
MASTDTSSTVSILLVRLGNASISAMPILRVLEFLLSRPSLLKIPKVPDLLLNTSQRLCLLLMNYLAQNLVREDLIVHIITQLGDDYSPIVVAIKVRDSSISYFELFDKLTNFERLLKDKGTSNKPLIAIANATQCHNQKSSNYQRPSPSSNQPYQGPTTQKSCGDYPSRNTQYNSLWSQLFCNYCDIPDHDTRECRKLARFCKTNNIFVHTQQPVQPPVANVTTSQNSHAEQSWLFDTGTSHHATSHLNNPHSFSKYGGLDEIFLGDEHVFPMQAQDSKMASPTCTTTALDAALNPTPHPLNGMWELIPKANHTRIGCKWIFHFKRKLDGSVDKYKVRLVAKDFLQEPGKDYFDTLSPVTKSSPSTLSCVLISHRIGPSVDFM